jgi:hypothetical protein
MKATIRERYVIDNDVAALVSRIGAESKPKNIPETSSDD